MPLFAPIQANAGLLSSIMGTEAYANIDISNVSPKNSNSQNMPLLQANVSSIPLVNKEDNKSPKVGKVDENKNINIVANNSLLASTSAVSTLGGAPESDSPSADQTSVYVIRDGDSISQIADMFGVSVNTILWANDMKKGDKLVTGDVLFILPISGLEHTVAKGETVKSIAALYKADVNDIIAYNDLSPNTNLTVGDKLMIPDAQKAEESDKPVKDLAASVAKDKQYYVSHPVKSLSGYYIDPVPGYRKSQGIHDNNAVDLAVASGTPIHAAASGRVILARTGYNGGFGNLVIISHPNGTETLYAHQSSIATETGAQVSQGQVIGYVGSTGRSTGPHLHFEVHGARNPGADGSWAN